MSEEHFNNPEYLLYHKNNLKNDIDKALNIVKNYIINNKLILVGGMAIHLSLKQSSHKIGIYDDFEIPDYDIISDNNVFHCEELAKILCLENLPNVSCIPAIHITTMKVMMSGNTILDATYIPSNIINKIPYIDYLNMKLIHPNYQKIDQYLSLSFLFEKTGISENIFHRMKKDITRNKLLVDYFPYKSNFLHKYNNFNSISIPLDYIYQKKINNNFLKIYNNDELIYNIDSNNLINNPNINFLFNNNNSYFETNNNICINGFLAYNMIFEKYSNIIQLYKQNNKLSNKLEIEIDNLSKNLIKTEFSIKNDNIIFSIPENENICLINNNNSIEDIINYFNSNNDNKNFNYYNKLLDIKPVSTIINYNKNNIELWDLFGKLLSSNLIQFKFNNINYNFIIANYNYILAYFLINYFDKKKDIYINYYSSLLNIINITKLLFNHDNSLFEKYLNQKYNNSIFNYSISTFGIDNYNESYYYYKLNFDYLVKNNKNSDLKPKKSFPKTPDCTIKQTTDLLLSPFFQIDGKLNNKKKKTNFSYIL